MILNQFDIYWKTSLYIYDYDAFNEDCGTVMLWEVWYECTSGPQLTFKCCLHRTILVIGDTGDG